MSTSTWHHNFFCIWSNISLVFISTSGRWHLRWSFAPYERYYKVRYCFTLTNCLQIFLKKLRNNFYSDLLCKKWNFRKEKKRVFFYKVEVFPFKYLFPFSLFSYPSFFLTSATQMIDGKFNDRILRIFLYWFDFTLINNVLRFEVWTLNHNLFFWHPTIFLSCFLISFKWIFKSARPFRAYIWTENNDLILTQYQ